MKHFFSNIFKGVKHRFFVKCKSISINSVKCPLQIIQICCGKEYTNRGRSRGRLQGVHILKTKQFQQFKGMKIS